MSREGYDVLRLIEHGQTCYISSEYVEGKILVSWLKSLPNITKEQLFSLIRNITNQLYMIHKCRKKPYYRYVNPYSIIITDEREIYFLDMEAGSNEEQLRLMQKRAIREYFLPAQDPYYQKASIERDIYGLGKSVQYLLAMARPEPPLCRCEEKKFLKIISKCLNDRSRSSYKNVSEIRRDIPKYKRKTKRTVYSKRRLIFIVIAVSVLTAAWKVQGRGSSSVTDLAVPELTEDIKKTEDVKRTEDAKMTGELQEIMSDTENVYMELAMLYMLDVEDYEKSLYYLERIQGDYIPVRNLQSVANALLGRKDSLKELETEWEVNLDDIESGIQEDNVGRYYECLMKGYALLDTEQSSKIVLDLGGRCLEQSEGDELIERKIREYMASASEKIGESEEAAHIYEELLSMETDHTKQKELYRKIAVLYEECGQNAMAADTCIQGIKEIEDSEELRIIYIRLLCKDTSVDRAVCAQVIREYIQETPEIVENEEFQKLQREYEIQVEGENICVGR